MKSKLFSPNKTQTKNFKSFNLCKSPQMAYSQSKLLSLNQYKTKHKRNGKKNNSIDQKCLTNNSHFNKLKNEVFKTLNYSLSSKNEVSLILERSSINFRSNKLNSQDRSSANMTDRSSLNHSVLNNLEFQKLNQLTHLLNSEEKHKSNNNSFLPQEKISVQSKILTDDTDCSRQNSLFKILKLLDQQQFLLNYEQHPFKQMLNKDIYKYKIVRGVIFRKYFLNFKKEYSILRSQRSSKTSKSKYKEYQKRRRSSQKLYSIKFTNIPERNLEDATPKFKEEYEKVRKAAVLARRMEYGYGIGTFAKSLIVTRTRKAKLIQNWWRAIESNNYRYFVASKIQCAFRMRLAYKAFIESIILLRRQKLKEIIFKRKDLLCFRKWKRVLIKDVRVKGLLYALYKIYDLKNKAYFFRRLPPIYNIKELEQLLRKLKFTKYEYKSNLLQRFVEKKNKKNLRHNFKKMKEREEIGTIHPFQKCVTIYFFSRQRQMKERKNRMLKYIIHKMNMKKFNMLVRNRYSKWRGQECLAISINKSEA